MRPPSQRSEMMSGENNNIKPGEHPVHPSTLEINVLNEEIKQRQDRVLAYDAELKRNDLPEQERLKRKIQMSELATEIGQRYEKRKELLDLLNSDSVIVRCTKCERTEKMSWKEADKRAPFVCPVCWLSRYFEENPELK